MKSAKLFLTLSVLLACVISLTAQPKAAATNSSANPLQQWIDENVDPGVLQLVDGVTGAHDFFTNLQQSFNGTNLFEMGSFKEVAVRVLPVLDQYEETEPYAIWLRAHLDDFDAANEMQRQVKATPPKTEGARVQLQHSIWVRQLDNRPLPPLAKTYLPKLKPIFIEEKVPPELAWVAGVESSFDSRARSPAGAAGMFQLMPTTARDEHLSRWPFDQRYQPEKSAHAAAHHLRELHSHYGDWKLALAAYNVGQGRVDKLLKTHKVHSFDAVAKWLPAETQMYVPKVEATILKREGRTLSELHVPRG